MLPLLANPISIASLGLTALSTGDKAKDFVANNWKTILIVSGVAVGGYFIYKKVTEVNNSIALGENPNEPKSGLTAFQAQKAADTLFNAMNRLGTDEQAIYEVLTGLTYNDFVKVSDAFGKRYYQKQMGMEGGYLFDEAYGLYEWLRFELSNDDFNHFHHIMPGVITNNKSFTKGATVIANKNDVLAFVAQKKNNSWVKMSLDRKYNKGEEIGDILHVNDNNAEGETLLVVDKSGIWEFGDVIVNANDVTVI